MQCWPTTCQCDKLMWFIEGFKKYKDMWYFSYFDNWNQEWIFSVLKNIENSIISPFYTAEVLGVLEWWQTTRCGRPVRRAVKPSGDSLEVTAEMLELLELLQVPTFRGNHHTKLRTQIWKTSNPNSGSPMTIARWRWSRTCRGWEASWEPWRTWQQIWETR